MKNQELSAVDTADVVKLFQPLACPVCGEHLGETACLDIVSQKDGGEFRVVCLKSDEAHDPNGNRYYEMAGAHGAGFVLAHVGRKNWANPHNILDAMWPWLEGVL